MSSSGQCDASIMEHRSVGKIHTLLLFSAQGLERITSILKKQLGNKIRPFLKTYAAISNASLNGESCLGPVFRPLTDSDQQQLPIFLCHIGVPTFSSQNN